MKKILFLMLLLTAHLSAQQNKVENRTEVDFDKIKNSTVIFTFGQSNSASHGAAYKPSHLYNAENKEVYNYFKGKLYKAQDPLLGTTGKGTSVWGRVADGLIEKKVTKAVTIIPIGVGGVPIASWAKGGSCRKLLETTLDQLIEKGVKIDCICWHQGESDNIANTSTQKYVDQFLTIREAFRSRGIEAPIVVAIASYHPMCLDEGLGCSDEIRNAQKQLAKDYDDIYKGPDTDKLNQLYQRADGIHFSVLGQQLHAERWVKVLAKLLK